MAFKAGSDKRTAVVGCLTQLVMIGTKKEMIMPESNAELAPRRWWQLKLVEILVVIAIVAVLIALLLPPVEWVSDGTRVLPVRVFVFDPQTGRPIPGAKIALSRGMGMYQPDQGPEIAKQFSGLSDWKDSAPPNQTALTDDQGFATVQFEFNVSASRKHPTRRAFPAKCWILVQAPGYGPVMVTAGNTAVEVQDVQNVGGFLVPVGLLRVQELQ